VAGWPLHLAVLRGEHEALLLRRALRLRLLLMSCHMPYAKCQTPLRITAGY
jgi:hypothetical protein